MDEKEAQARPLMETAKVSNSRLKRKVLDVCVVQPLNSSG